MGEITADGCLLMYDGDDSQSSANTVTHTYRPEEKKETTKQPSTAASIVAIVLYTLMCLLVGGFVSWLIFH